MGCRYAARHQDRATDADGGHFSPDTLYYHGDNIRLYQGGAVEYYTRKNRRDKGNKIGIWVDGPEWEKSLVHRTKTPPAAPSPRPHRANLYAFEPRCSPTSQKSTPPSKRSGSILPRRWLGTCWAKLPLHRSTGLGVQRPFSVYIRPDTVSAGGSISSCSRPPPRCV